MYDKYIDRYIKFSTGLTKSRDSSAAAYTIATNVSAISAAVPTAIAIIAVTITTAERRPWKLHSSGIFSLTVLVVIHQHCDYRLLWLIVTRSCNIFLQTSGWMTFYHSASITCVRSL